MKPTKLLPVRQAGYKPREIDVSNYKVFEFLAKKLMTLVKINFVFQLKS